MSPLRPPVSILGQAAARRADLPKAAVALRELEVLLRTYIATLNIMRKLILDPNYWVDVLCVVPVYVELGAIATDGADAEIHPALTLLKLLRLVRVIH